MNFDLDSNFQFSYQQLLYFLSRPGAHGYMFCQADDQRFIPRINQSLAEDLKAMGKDVRIAHLEPAGGLHLFSQIEQAARGAAALLIGNFFELINHREAGAGNLSRLNFAREALWQLGIPILFWTDSRSLHALANHAHDLYSQRRNTTVHFRGAFTVDVAKRVAREGWDQFLSSAEFHRIEANIELLEKRLAGAMRSDYPRLRIFSEIVLPLAGDYARVGLEEEAGRVLAGFDDIADVLDDPGDLIVLAQVQHALHRHVPALERLKQAREITGQRHSMSGIAGQPPGWYDILITEMRICSETGSQDSMLPELDAAILQLQAGGDATWARRQLSVMLSLKADVFLELGRLTAARELYAQSLSIADQLRTSAPQSVPLLRDLGVALDRMGYICEIQGQLSEAKSFYEQSLELTEQSGGSGPAAAQLQRDLSVSLGNVGNVYRELGLLEQAGRYYERSLKIVGQLAGANPHSAALQRDLGILLFTTGTVLQEAGNGAGAETCFRQCLDIREALCEADPESAGLRRDLSPALDKLGDLARESGEPAVAQHYYERSLDITEQLAAAHRESEQLQRDLSISLSRAGSLLEEQGRLVDARAYYEHSLAIRRRLSGVNPDAVQLRRDLGIALDDMGDILLALQQTGDAAACYRQSMQIREQLCESRPLPESLQRDLSISLYKLATVFSAEGKLQEALAYCRRGLQIAESLAGLNPLSKKLKDDLLRFNATIRELHAMHGKGV